MGNRKFIWSGLSSLDSSVQYFCSKVIAELSQKTYQSVLKKFLQVTQEIQSAMEAVDLPHIKFVGHSFRIGVAISTARE